MKILVDCPNVVDHTVPVLLMSIKSLPSNGTGRHGCPSDGRTNLWKCLPVFVLFSSKRSKLPFFVETVCNMLREIPNEILNERNVAVDGHASTTHASTYFV
jgi:hypothetical protein